MLTSFQYKGSKFAFLDLRPGQKFEVKKFEVFITFCLIEAISIVFGAIFYSHKQQECV